MITANKKRHLINPTQLHQTAKMLKMINPIFKDADEFDIESKIINCARSLGNSKDQGWMGTAGFLIHADDFGDGTICYDIYCNLACGISHDTVFIDVDAYQD